MGMVMMMMTVVKMVRLLVAVLLMMEKESVWVVRWLGRHFVCLLRVVCSEAVVVPRLLVDSIEAGPPLALEWEARDRPLLYRSQM